MIDTWNLPIKSFSRKIGVNANLVVKALAMEIFKRVIEKTPVDTGRAQASWNISSGYIDIETMPPGNYSKAEAFAKLHEAELTGSVPIYITNSLAYIFALEHGHSSQAPSGMVAITIIEIEEWLKQEIARLT